MVVVTGMVVIPRVVVGGTEAREGTGAREVMVQQVEGTEPLHKVDTVVVEATEVLGEEEAMVEVGMVVGFARLPLTVVALEEEEEGVGGLVVEVVVEGTSVATTCRPCSLSATRRSSG